MEKNKSIDMAGIIRTVINISLNILLLAVACLIIVNGAKKAYVFGNEIFDDTAIEKNGVGKATVVTITKGMSNKKVCDLLESEGLIEDKNVFFIKLILSDYKDTITPGTYTVSTANTPEEIMMILSNIEAKEEEE